MEGIMAKFKFKLQTLLNIKKQMEDMLKNDLAKAVRALEEERDICKKLNEEKAKCMMEMSGKAAGGVTIIRLRTYNTYISVLKEKIENQTKKVNSAQEIVDKYREELINAAKERKMLETLKEKQYNDYLKEQEKSQQKQVDELVSYKESKKRN